MSKYFFIIILMVVFPFAVFAENFSAEGFGDTADSARSAAMSELSFTIFSNVSSKLHYSANSDYNSAQQNISKQTDITSELPIIGAEISVSKVSDGFLAKALLKDTSALAYYSKLNETLKLINDAYANFKKEDSRVRAYDIVSSLLIYLDNYEKLNNVYTVLAGVSFGGKPPLTKEEAVKILNGLSDSFDDMKLCAKVMSKELNADNLFIYFPMAENSDEVTEFSSVFHGIIAAQMSPVTEILKADKYLNMQYIVTKDGLFLTGYLTDKNGKTLAVSNKRLQPSAYKGLDVTPESLSFEKLLKLGLSTTSDFKARITTKNGKRAVLYKEGEVVELFIKVNKPSYAYLVGHVSKEKEKYSYIVDLYNSDGNRKFIRYIDGDEINRWISLGQFEIVPPFGTEVFQMVADVDDPIDKLPAYKYDAPNNQYIVADNPEKGVAAVRAIKKIQGKSHETAEDVLIFSSTHK